MIDTNSINTEVIAIALQAGEAIMDVYQQDFEVIEKTDGSPLTLADKRAHEIIESGLIQITPDIPLLSEESGDKAFEERNNWNTFWMVDPLDGTKEFIRKNGEFTVNIALISEGVPRYGVVYAPALDTLWLGGEGVRASKYENDSHIPLITPPLDQTVRFVASRSHSDVSTDNFIRSVEQSSGLSSECISMGSSIKMCLVAEGKAELYPRFKPTSEWDTAAAHAIVLATGGDIVDLDRNRLRYNKDDILNPFFICYSANAPTWEAPRI